MLRFFMASLLVCAFVIFGVGCADEIPLDIDGQSGNELVSPLGAVDLEAFDLDCGYDECSQECPCDEDDFYEEGEFCPEDECSESCPCDDY